MTEFSVDNRTPLASAHSSSRKSDLRISESARSEHARVADRARLSTNSENLIDAWPDAGHLARQSAVPQSEPLAAPEIDRNSNYGVEPAIAAAELAPESELDSTTDERSLNADEQSSAANLQAAAERIWRMCLDTIRPQLSAQTMRTWFEPLRAVALEGSEMTLRAPSSFFCEWIGEHYQDILERSLHAVLGPVARFRFDSVNEVESLNTKLEPAMKSDSAPRMSEQPPAFRSEPFARPSAPSHLARGLRTNQPA